MLAGTATSIIFGFGSYYLAKLLRKGPEPLEEAIRGGDVVIKGKVGARTGIDQKGGTIIVGGDTGVPITTSETAPSICTSGRASWCRSVAASNVCRSVNSVM